MAINPIGKQVAIPPNTTPTNTGQPGSSGFANTLEALGASSKGKAEVFSAANAAPTDGVNDLSCGDSVELAATGRDIYAKFKSGELDINGYIEARIDHAMAHLSSTTSAARTEEIRAVLRNTIETDPGLIDLVERVTGQKYVAPNETT